MSVIYHAKLFNKCEDLIIFLVLFHYKLNIRGFWTIDHFERCTDKMFDCLKDEVKSPFDS